MKKIFTLLVIGVLSIAGLSTSALSQEQYEHAGKHQPFGFELTGDIGVYNQYIWRGAPQNVNKAAVQGDMGVGVGDFSASVWFSNTFASPAPQFAGQDAIEFDWTLDYSHSFGDFGVSVGTIYYTYLRDSTANFLEVYAGLSYDASISPSVAVYYTVADSSKTVNNLNETGDIWIDLGLSTAVKDVDLGATVSFVFYDSDPTRAADKAAGQFEDGASLVTVGISKDFEVSSLTITPSLNLYIPVASKAPGDGKRYIYNTVSDNNVVFGVNVAF
ncbi:MAG: TorF family putative porin [Mariprofundaceae bacterium]